MGGIRAVTHTDIWQFITFFSIIVAITWMMVRGIHIPVREIIPFLATHMHGVESLHHIFFPFKHKLTSMLYYLAFLAYIEPSTVQVVYMSASPMQARKVFWYASVCSIAVIGCIMLIGLSIFINMPSLSGVEVYGYLLAHASPYLQGLIAICLLAMAMSTADSKLHTSAILVSHDILSTIGRTRKSNRYQLLQVHIAMMAIALLAMLLTLYQGYSMGNMLSITCIYASVVVAPFILAVVGLCSSARTALLGMAAGLGMLLSWDKWISPLVGATSGTFVAILTNGLVMLMVHYVWPRPKAIKAPDGGLQ